MSVYFKHKINLWCVCILLPCFISCDKEESSSNNSESQKIDTIAFSYLAIGDSYTIGTALPDSSHAYPIQLINRLNQDQRLHGAAPDIIAFGGWRTDQLIHGIDTAQLQESYDLVSLLIGVNNQFQNLSDSIYALEFEELLRLAIQFAGDDSTRVFVLSIPDYGVTPFGGGNQSISDEINFFNDINREITASYGISYFNITEISRLAENNLDLLAPDNLHPSGEMYTLWVEEILSDVKSKLYE